MNRYELIYIIDTAVEESARKDLIERFTKIIVDNGGTVEKVDETWGKRRLAYTIDYKTEGYYVLTTYEANGDVPREVERNLEISEHVIRYLTVKLEEKQSKVKPRPVRQAPLAPPPQFTANSEEEAPKSAAPAAPAAEEAAKAPEVEPEPAVTEPAPVETAPAAEAQEDTAE